MINVRILAAVLAALPLLAAAQTDPANDWQWGLEAYLWGANVDVESATGSNVEIRFTDIVEDLELGGMALLAAHRGKWTVMADVIYLDIDDDVEEQIAAPIELKTLGLEAWVATPALAYQVFDGERLTVNLLGGARYLWIDVYQKFNFSAPLPPAQTDANESGSNWDGIVGARGEWQFNDKWYATYHADIGAGDSDLTYQVVGSAGYRFNRFDAVFGYRYLDWKIDGDALDSLDLGGFFAGVKFLF